MGLLPYGSKKGGIINFEGKDLNKITETNFCKLRGKKISMVFQEPMTALNPVLSIGKQIAETLVQHKACAPKIALAAFQGANRIQGANTHMEGSPSASSTVPDGSAGASCTHTRTPF